MSDDTGITPDHDDGAGEARDEQLRAQLAVSPLDEVTRRRLVRTAVDAARPSRARVRIAIAASVAAVAVGAVVAAGLALEGGGGGRPTAAPTTESKSSTHERSSGGADTQSKQPAGGPAPAAKPALPDLGDVTDPATLRQRVLAATGPPPATTSTGAVPCASRLREHGVRDVATVGEGTDDGRLVVVVTGTRNGAAVALSVLPGSCEIARQVVLHGD